MENFADHLRCDAFILAQQMNGVELGRGIKFASQRRQTRFASERIATDERRSRNQPETILGDHHNDWLSIRILTKLRNQREATNDPFGVNFVRRHGAWLRAKRGK